MWVLSFSGGTGGKEPACQCRRHKRHGFNPCVGKISWSRRGQPTPILLPGKFHGKGYSLLSSKFSISDDKYVSLPPGTGRIPFTQDIYFFLSGSQCFVLATS